MSLRHFFYLQCRRLKITKDMKLIVMVLSRIEVIEQLHSGLEKVRKLLLYTKYLPRDPQCTSVDWSVPLPCQTDIYKREKQDRQSV